MPIQYTSRFMIGILLLAVVVTLTAYVRGAASPAAQDQKKTIDVELISISELRKTTLGVAQDDASMNVFNRPGLTMQFRIDLPNNLRLIEVTQPSELKAKASDGADLTRVESGPFGEPQFVSMVMNWDGDPDAFDLTLAPTARNASTCSIEATCSAHVFRNIDTVEVPLSADWTTLDPALIDGRSVKYRMTSNGVKFQPGFIRPHFDQIELQHKGKSTESLSTMWNDQMCDFQFETKPEKGDTLTLSIRNGYEERPVRISMTDVDLP